MAHGTGKRNTARAPTPVFTIYVTLLQLTKDRRWQRPFAALCNSACKIPYAIENTVLSRHCSKASEIGIDKASDGVYTTGLNLLSQEIISCSDPVNMSLTQRRASSTPTTYLSPG